jgi:hypothetical protein
MPALQKLPLSLFKFHRWPWTRRPAEDGSLLLVDRGGVPIAKIQSLSSSVSAEDLARMLEGRISAARTAAHPPNNDRGDEHY